MAPYVSSELLEACGSLGQGHVGSSAHMAEQTRVNITSEGDVAAARREEEVDIGEVDIDELRDEVRGHCCIRADAHAVARDDQAVTQHSMSYNDRQLLRSFRRNAYLTMSSRLMVDRS
mgnify:CR=1 FL=1